MPRKKQQPEDESGRADNGDSSVYFSEKDGHWHGWVTVGVKDNGSPDRRHRMSKNEKKVRDAVRELEKQRDAGIVGKAGPAWTVEKWLVHWVENISAPTVRDSTADSYRNAVYNHLVPGLGKHRLERIQPDHFEKLYAKMQSAGHKPGNAHQVHRTAKTAFGEAVRRGHLGRNPVSLAKPPRMETRRSSRTSSTRFRRSSPPLRSIGTVPGGPSRSCSACARAKCSGSGGPTLT